MTIQVTQKIIKVDVENEKDNAVRKEIENAAVSIEDIERPDALAGTTYKIRTPMHEHAFYITITNIDAYGKTHPREIFISSKNMEQFQWIVALTRVISAIFRKGGDVSFLIEELRAVFDPKGGYFKNGKFVTSLVAEIGEVIERHLVSIGTMQKSVAAKSGTMLCPKCGVQAVVVSEGCATCMNCGESKCG
jgi:hypothetical protein